MNIEKIIAAYCEITGISDEELCGDGRSERLWVGRYMIWAYLHIEHNIPTSTIAERFRRSRANVFRGIRLLKHQVAYTKKQREQYTALKSQLKGRE